MGNLKLAHIIELVFWLVIAGILYANSFEFDREIEIYKYGASAWPRGILLLIVIAAFGQVIYHMVHGDGEDHTVFGTAADDGSEQIAETAHHTSLAWYVATFLILLIPFVYMIAPAWIQSTWSVDKAGLPVIKMVLGGVLLLVYLLAMLRNHVGGILALPLLFAAFLDDFGFYALAPAFIVGVMYLMGERRFSHMVGVALVTFLILCILFVSILYVGLPTGNVHPFYDFGTTLVNWLQ